MCVEWSVHHTERANNTHSIANEWICFPCRLQKKMRTKSTYRANKMKKNNNKTEIIKVFFLSKCEEKRIIITSGSTGPFDSLLVFLLLLLLLLSCVLCRTIHRSSTVCVFAFFLLPACVHKRESCSSPTSFCYYCAETFTIAQILVLNSLSAVDRMKLAVSFILLFSPDAAVIVVVAIYTRTHTQPKQVLAWFTLFNGAFYSISFFSVFFQAQQTAQKEHLSMNFRNDDLHMKTHAEKRRRRRRRENWELWTTERELKYPFQNAIQWNFCSVDDHKNLINILSDFKNLGNYFTAHRT